MKVLINVYEKYLLPKGGAGAVCYYYSEEQKNRGEHILEFLPNPQEVNKPSNPIKKLFEAIKNYSIVFRKLYFSPKPTGKDYNKYDVVHFHDTNSLYYAMPDLKDFRGKVILQSHSPQPLAEEQYEKMSKILKLVFPFAKQMYERMDRLAFERADYLIFPCEEAEDPYLKSLDYFNALKQSRPNAFRYVLTGIPAAHAKRDRKQVCDELCIPHTDFIITYVGRHNEIKGFDQLKAIAFDLFAKNSNMWVISAGKEEPIKRLEHPQWKEIGWTTDAHSYIAAADVFILPNKETYFDIVMLEILSLGKIVVASATGGNKYFRTHNCEGVFLYESKEECISIINRIAGMSLEERETLGKKNKLFFEKYLTVSSMYDNYKSMLESL